MHIGSMLHCIRSSWLPFFIKDVPIHSKHSMQRPASLDHQWFCANNTSCYLQSVWWHRYPSLPACINWSNGRFKLPDLLSNLANTWNNLQHFPYSQEKCMKHLFKGKNLYSFKGTLHNWRDWTTFWTRRYLNSIDEYVSGAPELHPQAQRPRGQSWRCLLIFI